MEEKRNALPVVWGCGIVSLVVSVANIGIGLCSDSLIINLGAKGYKALQVVGAGACAFSFALFAFVLVRTLLRRNKADKPAPAEESIVQDGMLAASGKLSDDYVMKKLVNQGLTKWKCIEGEVRGLTDQLILMNSYQDRLSKLLANNSAQALSDTEDILERIEQQILGNVRKVLNFMEILGTDDKQTVSEYIKVCQQDNAKLLDATKDFLLCVTGFLNGQGTNDEGNLQMVEDFKAILMGNIGDGSLHTAMDGKDRITLNL